mgnify:CR=1 FL=1
MIRTIAFALFAALFPLAAVHAGTAGQRPVNLILDTDIGPDYDDVGAMALMHALADNGEAKILATVACNTDARVVPCIEVINGWYGRKDIPVGAPKGYSAPRLTTSMLRTDWPGYLVSHFDHATDSTACAPSAVETYRRVLSRQPDGSVTICTLGFFSNLKALLASAPDRWSKLSGKDLVAKKVKLLVSMAGAFPNGYEFNVYWDADAARTVADEWPTPIIFSGWEIGSEIFTRPSRRHQRKPHKGRLHARPLGGRPAARPRKLGPDGGTRSNTRRSPVVHTPSRTHDGGRQGQQQMDGRPAGTARLSRVCAAHKASARRDRGTYDADAAETMNDFRRSLTSDKFHLDTSP